MAGARPPDRQQIAIRSSVVAELGPAVPVAADDGVHGDTNATFLAGDVNEEARLSMPRTRAVKAMHLIAIGPCRMTALG
jgi:methionyl aminopeptidase